MRPAPQKLSSQESLYAAALRALVRRAHSVFEMRTYLERRAEEPALARRVVARLRQEKLLDDARYAGDFARFRVKFRKQGRFRIVRELRQRGVPDQHIEAAVEEVFAETDERQMVRKIIERRLRTARGPLDHKKMASLYRTLLRAGFDAALIGREVRAAKPGDAGSTDDLPEADFTPSDS
jgi:regulatory protein